ncbi:antibiotic biosynthesis monooxygenase family protein [Nocardia spumae]|uniref:antibiotic biosynthesis monooxygenase family protein n=1 Tax=Nocardia spumae TaxID=2887190 RepID=UPI001D15A47A|nr:antibiotic biosynthesis monooxygenase family protein [Nocardia spumae]
MTAFSDPAVPDTDSPVTVINTMAVPVAQRDLFLQRWRDNAQYMASAPGFRRSRMFQAAGEAAEAVFVNVGDWDSGAALRSALDTSRWRRLNQRIQEDLDLTARPMIYRLAFDIAPGDVLSR